MSNNTIAVLGAGYVGLTTAALLANAGYQVNLVEPNQERLNSIKEGQSFFFEAGINPIIKQAIDAGTLVPTDSYEQAVPGASVVFSCVGTPDNPDGSSNLTYVFSAAEQAVQLMKPGTIYVQKSTVPVGTGLRVIDQFEKAGTEVQYVSNPEFLREGTALYDTLYFDRVVVGGSDQTSVDTVLDLYRQLESHRDDIAATAGIKTSDLKGRYISTSLNSAELIKVTANAFLALKISFANSIAKLADEVDADIVEVMDAVGADARIGRAFLNAGRGYGGGCFPKDVSGLISSGLEYGVDLEIMQAAQALNESMPGYIIDKLQDNLGGSLAGKKVAVLGLAFKPGTSDVRKSPGVAMANSLSKAGANVTAYDPEANDEAKPDLRRNIELDDSVEDAIRGADAVVIATAWPDLVSVDIASVASAMSGKVFVDAVNAFNKQTVSEAGMTYLGVGR